MGNNFYDHDRWVTESQGPIVDRTSENLGTTDRAIIGMRKMMLEAITALSEGRNPLFVYPSSDSYNLAEFFTGSRVELTNVQEKSIVQ